MVLFFYIFHLDIYIDFINKGYINKTIIYKNTKIKLKITQASSNKYRLVEKCQLEPGRGT